MLDTRSLRFGLQGVGFGDVSASDAAAWQQFQNYIGTVKSATTQSPPDLALATFSFNQALNLYQNNGYVAQQNGAYDPSSLGGDQLSYANTLLQQASGTLSAQQTQVQTTQGVSTDALTQAEQDPGLLAQGAQNAQPVSVLGAYVSGFGQGLVQGAGNLASGRWFFGTSPTQALSDAASKATDLSTPWPYLLGAGLLLLLKR